MLEKSFGLLFYLRKQLHENKGVMYIYLRITVDGASRDLSVKRTWVASRWSAKANRASGTREDARELNHYLDVLQSKAYEARKQLIDSGRIVTAVAIMDIMSGAEQRKRELMSLFKAHNDDMKAMIGKGVAKGTWTNFNTTYRHLSVFLQAQYNLREINIVSLDLEFVKRLYNWFRTVKGLGHNSSLKNIANMKKIIIGCIDNGWLKSDPWANGSLAISAFGAGYILMRLFFAHYPDKFGGARVAMVCLAIEGIGQLLIWQAPGGSYAIAGAVLTGCGMSLVFPAFGQLAIKNVSQANRGMAMAAYNAFFDLGMGLTAPIAGLIARGTHYENIYLVGGIAAIAGLVLASRDYFTERKRLFPLNA